MTSRFLRELAGILSPHDLRVNPAIPTLAPEFPTVPGIIRTDGLPLAAILLDDLPLEELRRQLPILLARTPAQQARLLAEPLICLQTPDLIQTARSRWLLAFGEVRTLQHWAQDPRCRVAYKTLYRRLESDWSPEDAITQPAAAQKPAARQKRVLYHHQSGQWAKRINGRVYYFGSGSYEQALGQYLQQRQAIESGRPEDRDRNPTLRNLANRFLDAKRQEVEAGRLNPRTYADYRGVLERAMLILGTELKATELNAGQFSRLNAFLVHDLSARTCGNLIRRLMVFVNWVNAHQILEQPIVTGPDFRPPSRLTVRRETLEQQRKHGLRMFETAECHLLLRNAPMPLRAMLLLGLNCGMGNTDCSELPQQALNLKTGWLDYPRPKTLVPRIAKLWPETVAALRLAIETRPAASSPAEQSLVFLTRFGRRFVRSQPADDAISKEFAKLLRATELKRHGLNFYALRHTFQTTADQHGDDLATKISMGHLDNSMSATYRQRFPPERLEALANYLREQLVPPDQRVS